MSPRVNDRVRFAHAHGPWMPGDAGVVASEVGADGEVLVAFDPWDFSADVWRDIRSGAWLAAPLASDLSSDYRGDPRWFAWVPAYKLEVSDG